MTPKLAKWACSDCPANGWEASRTLARDALAVHFGAVHNGVPWMDDE